MKDVSWLTVPGFQSAICRFQCLGACGTVEHSDREAMIDQSCSPPGRHGSKDRTRKGLEMGHTLPRSGPDGHPLPRLCHTDHNDAIKFCVNHHINPPVGSVFVP